MEYWLPAPRATATSVEVEQAPSWLAVGAEVEVQMQEEGLRSSQYSGRVLQLGEQVLQPDSANSAQRNLEAN